MFTDTSYRMLYLEDEERNVEQSNPEMTKVNEINSFFSNAYDRLMKALPNIMSYGRTEYDDNNKGELGNSTGKGHRHIVNCARIETKLRFELLDTYVVFNNSFREPSFRGSFSLV